MAFWQNVRMSDAPPFVHLHMHTSYSLLDSSVQVKPAVARAAELGMPALAITDHGVLHGAINFYTACKGKGIKPIIGCEVYVCRDRHEKSRNAGPMNHMLLLAKDFDGYENLARIVSVGHTEGFYYKPRVDVEILDRYHEGLIATSCCERGTIPAAIIDGNMDKARELAGTYADIFGEGNFYLELEDHGKETEKQANRGIVEIAKSMNLPLVATNDVHYMDRAHAEAHEVLLCLQMQTVMRDEKRLKFASDEYYFKTQQEMWDLFGEIPEALHATTEIMEKCDIEIPLEADAPLHFPNYDVPEGHDFDSYLTYLAVEGIKENYNGADITNPQTELEHTLKDRFDMEFGVIKRTGFVNYFLVVWDFVAEAKRMGVPVGPGRGSGAGSLMAYALSITTIDPLHFNLIFERFLNPDRVSPPDFDIDFCQARRVEVIDYVKDKYGQENCAQIITFGTLGAKTIIRDIGRVLEIPLSECDKLAKLVPDDPGMTIAKAEEANPEFKAALQTDPNAKQIMQYARVLEGLHRNQGTHAAGVVIGEKPLMDIIPLCKDKEGQPVAQFEMKPLEMTGLLKMDFLGLKTLTVVREALDHVKDKTGEDIDPDRLDTTDSLTYELLGRGDTVGVFQVESKGMRDLLRQFQADCLEEIIALIALYRPGPMDMIPDYIARKHGHKTFEYEHPKLEPVLKETYGVFIYQEQVQQASNVLAGFTLAQGDLLRRAMGKKNMQIMAEMKAKFVAGCKEVNDIAPELATHIFETIEKFASYGFNKSHSAAYAMVSFQTAWLKAHHPAEFMSALLSSEMGNTDKLTTFIGECQEMGMEVLPPNIQQSTARFRPEDGNIRFGLAGIKGVGQGAVDAIVADREAHGPFESFMDFFIRVNSREVNKKAIESLINCGAFDWTGLERGRMFQNIEFAMQRAETTRKDREAGQTNLFDLLGAGDDDGGGSADTSDSDLPETDPWSTDQKLAIEKDLVGFFISGHPLHEFLWDIDHYASHTFTEMAELDPGTPIRVAGLITDAAKLFGKKDSHPLGVFTLEGQDGAMPAILFSDGYERFGAAIENDRPVMVGGELSLRDNSPQIVVNEICSMRDAPNWYAEQSYLHLTEGQVTGEHLAQLKEVCQSFKGRSPLIFCVEYDNGQRVYLDSDAEFHVHPTQEFVRGVEHILGEGRVYVQTIAKIHRFEPQRRSFRKTASG